MARVLSLFVVALALPLGVVPSCSQPDRAAYVKANSAILTELPTYPSATFRSMFSNAYRECDTCPIFRPGYTTAHEYRLPETTRAADVASFYERRLSPRWQLVERDDRPDGPALTFRRGRAYLWIDLEGMGGHQRIVAVDHARY